MSLPTLPIMDRFQNAGDLWYFPPGIPHSLQATADIPEGSEFLLVRHTPVYQFATHGSAAHRCFPTAISAKPLHFKLSLPHRVPCLRCNESCSPGNRLARSCSEGGHREELPDGYHQFRPHSVTGVVHLSHECISDYLGCAHIF